MLPAIALVMPVMWRLTVSSTPIGGLIHLLLVLTIVIVLLRLIRGRRAVGE